MSDADPFVDAVERRVGPLLVARSGVREIAEAVAKLAHPDTAVVVELQEVIAQEVIALWTDLGMAARSALRGDWSIRCDDLAERIRALEKVAGPMSWQHVRLNRTSVDAFVRLREQWGQRLSEQDYTSLVQTLAQHEYEQMRSTL